MTRALGGVVQSTLNELSDDQSFYATCDTYQQIIIGKKSFELFTRNAGSGKEESSFGSIILCGSTSTFLEEAQVGLIDAIMAVKHANNNGSQIAVGGGAFEIKVSGGIDSGSQSIVNGVLAASAMISVGLRGGGYYLKSNLEKHQQPMVVSPFVSSSIKYIKSATPYAASGSSFIVSNAVEVVGGGLVNSVMYFTPKGGSEDNETFNAAAELGKSSIKAIASISHALSEGISQIVEEASGTTLDVVHHKLGTHVANVTKDTFSISKDVVNTALTLQMGSAKAVAIKVISNGGAHVVEKQFGPKGEDIQSKDQELLESSSPKVEQEVKEKQE
eukprot:gene7247-8424_t